MTKPKMDKLETGEYFSARSVLQPLDIHLAVEALLEGSSPGEIYVDDRKEPRSAFVGTMGRYFLSGASSNEEFNLAVKSRFDEQISKLKRGKRMVSRCIMHLIVGERSSKR